MNSIRKVHILGFGDNLELRKKIESYIFKNIKCDIFTFNTIKEFKTYKHVYGADLYIFDENLGFNIFDELILLNNVHATILFIINENSDITEINNQERFCCSETDHIMFDFLKPNFSESKFIFKIKFLMKISKKQKDLNKILIKSKIKQSIWKVLYYSNFYVLILDCDLNIKLINNKLMEDLNIKTRKEVLGKNWLEFVGENFKKCMSDVCYDIKSYSDTQEICIDLIKKTNQEVLSVKMYNSYISNRNNYVLCIGIPILNKININDNIDSIREYYRDMIKKDKIMIQNILENDQINKKKIAENDRLIYSLAN